MASLAPLPPSPSQFLLPPFCFPAQLLRTGPQCAKYRNDDVLVLQSKSTATMGSCRKKNFGSGSFVSNLRDHIHEFIHASMDEHRTCMKETVRKMFERAKLYREKSGGGPKEGETPLPLQTTTD